MYMFGFRDDPPRYDRFSYVEKFDYWAVYWGMVVMILSGLVLWFEDASLALLPKYFLDIAHEAHSDEALLATLAIIVWHFYNAHFNPDRFPMSWSWWHGKISQEEMKHHHAVEYERMVNEARGEVGKGKEAPSLKEGEGEKIVE
jgi:cytochrome b subunit of formate dehydrogenase